MAYDRHSRFCAALLAALLPLTPLVASAQDKPTVEKPAATKTPTALAKPVAEPDTDTAKPAPKKTEPPKTTAPAAPVKPEAPKATTPVAPKATTPAAPKVTTPAAPVKPEAPKATTPVAPKATTPAAPVKPEPTKPTAPATAKPATTTAETTPVAPVAVPAVDTEKPAPAVDTEKPAPAPEPAKKPESVALEGSWTKKFVLRSEDGAFSFQPTGRVQPLFRLPINPDVKDPVEPIEGVGFSFKRARFGFQAVMFQQVTMYMDADFAKGSASLVDYYLDYNPLGGKGDLDGVAVLRMGHFRPWFGRQFLMPTGKMQLVEDAQAWKDADLGLALQRDLGLGIHGMVLRGIEYGIGIWNGEDWPSKVWNGQDDASPSQFDTKSPGTVGIDDGVDRIPGNIDFMFGGRVAVHPLALANLSTAIPANGGESDDEISVKPRLSVGLSLLYNKRHNQLVNMAGPEDEADDFQLYYDSQVKLGVDLAFFWMGLGAQAELYVLSTEAQGDTPALIQTQLTAASLDGTGLGSYLQLGYFVWPKRIEVAARFDMVDEDLDVAGMRLYPGLGVTGHIFGNNLKAQLMYRLNAVTGYKPETPTPAAYQLNPTSHDLFIMLQASI